MAIGDIGIDWDRIAKQKIMYQELDKFTPGQFLQYFPVSKDELKKWQEQQDKKAMEEWERNEAEKKKEMLKTNTELSTGNGHNNSSSSSKKKKERIKKEDGN